MESSKSSKLLSIISVIISLVTLFFAYIKPQWIDKSELRLFPIKTLTITSYFGDIQLRKLFSIVNTGKQPALINNVDCFLIREKTWSVYHFDDAFFVSDPDFKTMDRQTRFTLLSGISVWANNGYGDEFYYLMHHDQNYLNAFQEIRDSVESERKRYSSRFKSPWLAHPDSFTYSNTIKNRIVEVQSPLYELLSPGAYFICERLLTTDGEKIYQVYTFQLTKANVEKLKSVSSEMVGQNSINTAQMVSVDIKLAAKEDIIKVRKKIEQFLDQ